MARQDVSVFCHAGSQLARLAQEQRDSDGEDNPNIETRKLKRHYKRV